MDNIELAKKHGADVISERFDGDYFGKPPSPTIKVVFTSAKLNAYTAAAISEATKGKDADIEQLQIKYSDAADKIVELSQSTITHDEWYAKCNEVSKLQADYNKAMCDVARLRKVLKEANSHATYDDINYRHDCINALSATADSEAWLEDCLKGLTNNERLELFAPYCKHCGSKDPQCQCWNDE